MLLQCRAKYNKTGCMLGLLGNRLRLWAVDWRNSTVLRVICLCSRASLEDRWLLVWCRHWVYRYPGLPCGRKIGSIKQEKRDWTEAKNFTFKEKKRRRCFRLSFLSFSFKKISEVVPDSLCKVQLQEDVLGSLCKVSVLRRKI